MNVVVAVLLGGVGSLVRAEATARVGVRRGTAAVNLAGSFLLGLVVGLAGGYGADHAVLVLVGAGFADGLTTFSNWMLDVVDRPRSEWPLSVVVTLLAGLVAAGVGWFLGALIH